MKISKLIMPGLLVLVLYGCSNKTSENISIYIEPCPRNIHWGTSHNTLRGVTITWQNTSDSDSIRWGYSSEYEIGTFPGEGHFGYQLNSDEVYLYNYKFPVLKESMIIHYSIKSKGKWGEKKIFKTSVDTSSNYFSFTSGGDSQTNMERWSKVSEMAAKDDIDFHLHLGDAVHDGDDWDQWRKWYKYGSNFLEKNIIFHCWGNHDYDSIALDNCVLPGNEKWYSFEQGNALFICLLSEEDFDIQYTWLLDQLKKTDKKWIIVYFHKPFFTRGSHRHEMDDYRKTWWKAFDDYGVDIIISGHTHSYIRTKPLNPNVSDSSSVAEYGSKPGQGRLEFVSGGLGGDNSKASQDWFAAKAYSGLHYIKFDIKSDILHFDTYTDSGALIDSLTMYSDGTPFIVESNN